MKAIILFAFIISAATANSQSLKDLLYSGKLKKDSTGVIRKTDDLSTKIDTSTKKVVEPQTTKTVQQPQTVTPVKQTNNTVTTNPVTITATTTTTVNNDQVAETEGSTPTTTTNKTAAPVKSNNKIWKEYTDEMIASLKDVIANKKVKKESYFFQVEYEIGIDGKTSILGVTISPENDLLLAQVRQKLDDTPPALNPVLNSNNQPQKIKRRYNFFINKE